MEELINDCSGYGAHASVVNRQFPVANPIIDCHEDQAKNIVKLKLGKMRKPMMVVDVFQTYNLQILQVTKTWRNELKFVVAQI